MPTELQFDGSSFPSATNNKDWLITFHQDSVRIHDRSQGKALSWNFRELGCFNIVKHIRYVSFSNLHDGKMCLSASVGPTNIPELWETEFPTVITEDKGIEIRDETKDFHLMINILIIASVSMIVILICVIGLVKQCRRCCARVFCLDKCCRSSYNVSRLERRQRYHNIENVIETPTTGFSDSSSRSSSNSSNTSTLLQI